MRLLGVSVEATAWNLFLLLLNCAVVGQLSLFGTWLIRRWALPAHVSLELPLNFVFRSCPEGGVCSFPTANLSLPHRRSLFTPATPYSVVADLQLPDVTANRELGMLLAVLEFRAADGALLGSLSRSFVPPLRSWPVRAARTAMLLPLNLLWEDTRERLTARIPFATAYRDSPIRPTTLLSLQIQTQGAILEGGEVKVAAVFGPVRHFLYWWPFSSSALLFFFLAAWLSWLSALYWGRRGLSAALDAMERYELGRNHDPPAMPDIVPQKEDDTPAAEPPVRLRKHSDSDPTFASSHPAFRAPLDRETELRRRKSFHID